MLDTALTQLEQSITELMTRNRELVDANVRLSAELASAKDENDTLQLSVLELEEKQSAASARVQALNERLGAVAG